jgi:hypothetical protein
MRKSCGGDESDEVKTNDSLRKREAFEMDTHLGGDHDAHGRAYGHHAATYLLYYVRDLSDETRDF